MYLKPLLSAWRASVSSTFGRFNRDEICLFRLSLHELKLSLTSFPLSTVSTIVSTFIGELQDIVTEIENVVHPASADSVALPSFPEAKGLVSRLPEPSNTFSDFLSIFTAHFVQLSNLTLRILNSRKLGTSRNSAPPLPSVLLFLTVRAYHLSSPTRFVLTAGHFVVCRQSRATSSRPTRSIHHDVVPLSPDDAATITRHNGKASTATSRRLARREH